MIEYQANSRAPETDPRSRSAEVPAILLLEESPGEAELFCEALVFAWDALESEPEVSRPRIDVQRTAQDALDSLRKTCELKQRNLPDLVVLDLDLPLGTSLVFLRELRQDPRLAKLPVIVMAWSDEQSIVRSLGELGVVGYVVKPMLFEDLVTIVGDFCRQVLPEATRQELYALDRRRQA